VKIESGWVNGYLGGTWTFQCDQDLYSDEGVIARRYSGPAATASGGESR
jgi:hypothetical protein